MMRLAIPPPHQCVIYISWYSKHHPKTLDMSYTLAQMLLLCQSGFTGFEFLCVHSNQLVAYRRSQRLTLKELGKHGLIL